MVVNSLVINAKQRKKQLKRHKSIKRQCVNTQKNQTNKRTKLTTTAFFLHHKVNRKLEEKTFLK